MMMKHNFSEFHDSSRMTYQTLCQAPYGNHWKFFLSEKLQTDNDEGGSLALKNRTNSPSGLWLRKTENPTYYQTTEWALDWIDFQTKDPVKKTTKQVALFLKGMLCRIGDAKQITDTLTKYKAIALQEMRFAGRRASKAIYYSDLPFECALSEFPCQ